MNPPPDRNPNGDLAAQLFWAADRLDTLSAAASPGPWSAGDVDEETGKFLHRYGDFGWYITGPAGSPEFEDSEQGKADASYVAAMQPSVGAALARWLRESALVVASYEPHRDGEFLAVHALAIARAILADQKAVSPVTTECPNEPYHGEPVPILRMRLDGGGRLRRSPRPRRARDVAARSPVIGIRRGRR